MSNKLAERIAMAYDACEDTDNVGCLAILRTLLAEFTAHEAAKPEPVGDKWAAFGYLRKTNSTDNPPHGWAFHFCGKPGDVAVWTSQISAAPVAQATGCDTADEYLTEKPAPAPEAAVTPSRCQCGYPMPCSKTVPVGFCRSTHTHTGVNHE